MTDLAIRGVPTEISREDLSAFLAALGISPDVVPRGAALMLGPTSVSIDVLATGPDGSFMVAPNGQEAAMHRISIPIVGDPPQPRDPGRKTRTGT